MESAIRPDGLYHFGLAENPTNQDGWLDEQWLEERDFSGQRLARVLAVWKKATIVETRQSQPDPFRATTSPLAL